MSLPGDDPRPDELARAYRVLRATWVIVSASQRDAVARDVAAMGDRLRSALDQGDHAQAVAAVAEVRSWLATMAGVVTSRLCQAFELDDGGRDPSAR